MLKYFNLPVVSRIALALIIVVFFIVKKKPVYDIEYYIAHPDERTKLLKECRNDAKKMASDFNCQNAAEAEYKAMFRGPMPKMK